MDLKEYISKTFKINMNDESFKILSDRQNQNYKLKTYAVIGDKMVIFLDFINNKKWLSSEMDNFRQKYSSNEFWTKCFNH